MSLEYYMTYLHDADGGHYKHLLFQETTSERGHSFCNHLSTVTSTHVWLLLLLISSWYQSIGWLVLNCGSCHVAITAHALLISVLILLISINAAQWVTMPYPIKHRPDRMARSRRLTVSYFMLSARQEQQTWRYVPPRSQCDIADLGLTTNW